jgi:hypothetical protein
MPTEGTKVRETADHVVKVAGEILAVLESRDAVAA